MDDAEFIDKDELRELLDEHNSFQTMLEKIVDSFDGYDDTELQELRDAIIALLPGTVYQVTVPLSIYVQKGQITSAVLIDSYPGFHSEAEEHGGVFDEKRQEYVHNSDVHAVAWQFVRRLLDSAAADPDDDGERRCVECTESYNAHEIGENHGRCARCL